MRFREVLQQLSGMLGSQNSGANPMTATPEMDVRQAKAGPSGNEGMGQGFQGIGQGHIGSLFGSLLGPQEGINRAATGGMDGKPPGLSDAQPPSFSGGIAESTDLGQTPTNQEANPMAALQKKPGQGPGPAVR